MNIREMKDYLIKRFDETGYIPGFTSGVRNLSFSPETFYKVNIMILYPGYKNGTGVRSYDYCVQLRTNKYATDYKSISHKKIMENFASIVSADTSITDLAIEFLGDVFHNWENVSSKKYIKLNFPDFTVEEMIECICFIAVQEEINYPQEKRFMGYKRPFYSYLESIYASNGSEIISFEEAINRCNSKQRINEWPSIDYSIFW